MSPRQKTVITWLGLIVLALICLRLAGVGTDLGDMPGAADLGDPGDPELAYQVVEDPEQQAKADGARSLPTADLPARLEEGGVEAIVYDTEGGIFLRTTDGPWPRLEGGWAPEASRGLASAGLQIETLHDVQWDTGILRAQAHGGFSMIDTLGSLLAPLLLLLGLLVLLVWWLKRRQSQAGGILQLRKSSARTLEAVSQLAFEDVGGLQDVKSRLADVIDVLKEPARWTRAGVRPPKGVLLWADPLWIKIADDEGERLVPKSRLLSLESLGGTDAFDLATLPPKAGPVGVA